jgi:hypothetical protein
MFGTTAIHDVFSLYGRPRAYSWDPRDEASMMYAYPVGPARDVSFHPPFSVLLSPINYYPVTFLGTRNGREHGSPDRSHLCCSVPSFERPLSSYTSPFVSERGPKTIKFQCVRNASPYSFYGRASHGNATRRIYLSSPPPIPCLCFVGA